MPHAGVLQHTGVLHHPRAAIDNVAVVYPQPRNVVPPPPPVVREDAVAQPSAQNPLGKNSWTHVL